ncbi:MAG: PilZ domain-containing protein [Proteobacteria bacterium]|nr:MAG: PilZ domain-containing protein [Pseudomonadota bacterium]
MSSPSPAMMRSEPRASVLPIEIKGLLSWRDERTLQLPFFVWDISVGGIGVLMSDELKAGEIVQLTFGHPMSLTVTCEVSWCVMQEADYDFQEPSFRCGLKVNQPGINFQGLVDHINLLRNK